jgi:hypothetical protein
VLIAAKYSAAVHEDRAAISNVLLRVMPAAAIADMYVIW